MFKGFELLYKGSKHLSKGFEHKFKGFEHKISREEKDFSQGKKDFCQGQNKQNLRFRFGFRYIYRIFDCVVIGSAAYTFRCKNGTTS